MHFLPFKNYFFTLSLDTQTITEAEKDSSPPAKEQEDEPMQVEIKEDCQEVNRQIIVLIIIKLD